MQKTFNDGIIIPTKFKNIHFIGIGGAGMSGIAEIMHNLGFVVTGSDIKKTPVTERLESLGVKIFYHHNPKNVKNAHLVVYSSAVKGNNPEIVEALKMKIPVIPRAEMLAELMRVKYSIAVSGAHGKTTTTSMIGHVLNYLGFDPTIVVGGRIMGVESGAKVGRSPYMVVEADESDASFLKLNPTIAVVTNVDKEHLDFYGNFISLLNAFVDFVNKIPFYGVSIINIDDEFTKEVSEACRQRRVTYGVNPEADFKIRDFYQEGLISTGKAVQGNEVIGEVVLNIPGRHNLINALVCFAVANELDIPYEGVIEALKTFKGVSRRLEIKGIKNGVEVIDDYGHHPKEIHTVYRAIREYKPNSPILVVFQPHRYTRTQRLYKEFAQVLKNFDKIVILPIYPAGETPLEGVSERLIYNELILEKKDNVFLTSGFDEAYQVIKSIIKDGDILLTLGAGDVYKVGTFFLEGE